MKVEVYHFNERTLDPWMCRVEELEMTEEEFDKEIVARCRYVKEEPMFYSEDGSIGYFVLEY